MIYYNIFNLFKLFISSGIEEILLLSKYLIEYKSFINIRINNGIIFYYIKENFF